MDSTTVAIVAPVLLGRSAETAKTRAAEVVKDGSSGGGESKREKLARALQEKDPVSEHGRCTFGRLAFCLLVIAGIVFLIFGLTTEDYWEASSAIVLVLLSLYAATFVGGDLWHMREFQERLNAFRLENIRLTSTIDSLQTRLGDLSYVASGLDSVCEQMGADIHAAKNLLKDMERFTTLQTVSAVVHQFFSADWDNSGHISGEEAGIFIPQLTSLWNLVRNFDPSRLAEHVRQNGLTLSELSVLIDSMVVDDAVACQEKLESMCNEKAAQLQNSVTSASEASNPFDAELGTENAGNPFEGDVELGGRPMRMQTAEVQHAASLPKEVDESKEEERTVPTCKGGTDVLQPLFTIGPYPVWSVLHLVLILVTVVAIVFVVAAFVIFELTNIICSLITLIISGGLVGESRQLEILHSLRKQMMYFCKENDRLEKVNDGIAQQVAELTQLQRGFEKLQSECQGNVSKAHELMQKSNTSVKMSAVGVVTRLFKDADKNRNYIIDPTEIDAFVASLETVFRSVDGFSSQQIREIMSKSPLHANELKQVVDLIFKA